MKLQGGIYGMTRERALQFYNNGYQTIHSIATADSNNLIKLLNEIKSFEESDNYFIV